MSRQATGQILATVGLLAVLLFALSDFIGLGDRGQFGPRQAMFTIAGVVTFVLGSVLWLTAKKEPEADTRPSKVPLLLVLFLVSLTVRMAFTIPVIASHTPLRGDENQYVWRGSWFEVVTKHVLRGEDVPREALDGFYSGGLWGPLFPVVLGLAFRAFDTDMAAGVARLTVTMVSALTSPLVYSLTDKLSTHRAGLIAAAIHIFYSTFVAFAHLLWAETFFILFMLLAIYLASQLRDASRRRQSMKYAVATGFVLGLGGLTRPAALFFLFLIPLWVGLSASNKRLRIILPIVIVLTWMVMLSPWETVLIKREGHFVFLANTGSLNLFKGNRPEGLRVSDIKEYALENNLDVDVVMRDVALQEISQHPAAFIVRGLDRAFREIWGVDAFVFKHVRRAVYPPLPHILVGLWFLGSLVGCLSVVTLAGLGFAYMVRPLANLSNLLLVLILSNLLYPLVSDGGYERLVFVNLALMLPAAGHGAAHIGQFKQLKHKALAVGLVSVMPILILSTLLDPYDDTTGYYASLVSKQHALSGQPTFVVDQFTIRAAGSAGPDEVRIKALNPEYYLYLDEEEQSDLVWMSPAEGGETTLVVYSYDAARPASLEIASGNGGESVRLVPTNRAAWNQWQPTGVEGIEYKWLPMTSTSGIPSFLRIQPDDD